MTSNELYTIILLLSDYKKGRSLHKEWRNLYDKNALMDDVSYLENYLLENKLIEPGDSYRLLHKYTVDDLKTILRSVGMSTSGNKDTLIHRILSRRVFYKKINCNFINQLYDFIFMCLW